LPALLLSEKDRLIVLPDVARSFMEPHRLPHNTVQLHTAHDGYLQQHIPWWQDISAHVRAELRLTAVNMRRKRQVDIVVIGGGVAGLSAALSAQTAGARVLLLEATAGLGRGASGRNAGILSAGVNMGSAGLDPTGPQARFWPETTEVLLALVAQAREEGSLLQAQLTGALSLAESAHAARALAREVKARTALGGRAELWTAEQVGEQTGGRLHTRGVIQAMWLPDEGRVHPLTLLAWLARAARAAGVEMVGNAAVAEWQENEGAHEPAGWRLTLQDGTVIQAEGLICAVGPTSRPNARIYALTFAASLPETFPLLWDAAPYTYADYRAGCGRLTVSGGRYGKPGGGRHEEKYYQRLAAGARRWLPELGDLTPTYQWSVDLETSAALVPQLRVCGRQAPGLAIEGLGALGVLPGLVLGKRGGELLAHTIGQTDVLARAHGTPCADRRVFPPCDIA
jgi:glycine/D-amino acid oxidase-like deaminating enzyme